MDINDNSHHVRQLVGFRLGNEEFAIDILQVQEINRTMEITGIPKAAEFIEGVINLRGRVIPVISLQKRFDLELSKDESEHRIVVVDIGNNNVAGFLVDSVTEVMRVSESDIEPAPDMVAGMTSHYLSGVINIAERLIILLDLDHILSAQELAELKMAA